MIAAIVLASNAVAPGVSVHEIVVTGERVSRSIHETASSASIATGVTIDTQAAPDRVQQLLRRLSPAHG